MLYQKIQIYTAFEYIISNFLNFFESLRFVLITYMVATLMISAKFGYDVIIYVHDITNKILSCDLNYIVDVVM